MGKLSKSFSVVLIISMITSCAVKAAPTMQDINKVTCEIQNSEKQLETLDSQIEHTMRDLEDNKAKINRTQSDISKLELQIKDTENDIENRRQLLKKRVRAAYVTGIDGYIEVLMNVKNFNELLSSAQMLKDIIAFDLNFMENLSNRNKKVETQKESLKDKNTKLAELQNINNEKLKELDTKKSETKKILADTMAKKQLYITQYNKEQARIKAEIQARLLEEQKREEQKRQEQARVTASRTTSYNNRVSSPNRESSSNSGTSYTSNVSDTSIIAYAMKFLGTPYVWGGTTPSPGFDCSGYMQYVYGHFGISIGRTTYEQIHDGVEVSKNNLKPGDLVLFGTWDDPHHVGMYIGSGQYIHAPYTGDVIKISSLDRSDFLTARRIKN